MEEFRVFSRASPAADSEFERLASSPLPVNTPTRKSKKRPARTLEEDQLITDERSSKKAKGPAQQTQQTKEKKHDKADNPHTKKIKEPSISRRQPGVPKESHKASFERDDTMQTVFVKDAKIAETACDYSGVFRGSVIESKHGDVMYMTRHSGSPGRRLDAFTVTPASLTLMMKLGMKIPSFRDAITAILFHLDVAPAGDKTPHKDQPPPTPSTIAVVTNADSSPKRKPPISPLPKKKPSKILAYETPSPIPSPHRRNASKSVSPSPSKKKKKNSLTNHSSPTAPTRRMPAKPAQKVDAKAAKKAKGCGKLDKFLNLVDRKS